MRTTCFQKTSPEAQQLFLNALLDKTCVVFQLHPEEACYVLA